MAGDEYIVALVTGATGVIGGAIARELAATPGYRVILLARDELKARESVSEIHKQTGNDQIEYVLADLSRQESIRDLARKWRGPLHVLINNAAVTPRRRGETPEGIELTFATNALGYLWTTEALRPRLEASAPARVVNVASYWAGDLDLDDLEFRRRPYDNHPAYRQSKQANRMLTVALAEALDDGGISVNVCHPGDVRSTLSGNLGFGGSDSPAGAARTPVMLARGELGEGTTGRYFENGRETPCRFARDRNGIQRLYEICLAYP